MPHMAELPQLDMGMPSMFLASSVSPHVDTYWTGPTSFHDGSSGPIRDPCNASEFSFPQMPNGMRFLQLYVMMREDEKRIQDLDGESPTGPYPASWSAACKYFDFNLPRKKNQQEFAAATRSLFFVEIPFLYSERYL